MSLATIDGNDVTHARVQIPSWGVWWADVSLVGEVELSGSVVLTVADLELTGTVVVGGTANGRSGYRIAGGAGAWGNDVSALAYANDATVRRAALAKDAADAVGETIDTTGLTGTTGTAFVRAADQASKVLDHVAPRAWYVNSAGVTVFGARASAEVVTTAARVRVDPSAGVIVLASQDVADLLPGAIVDGLTAVDTHIEVSPEDGCRVTLRGSRFGVSRRVEAFRRIVRSILPEYKWHGVYEYRVTSMSGERLSLQPVLTSINLPVLGRVPVRQGVPGAKADHKLGSQVLVSFINADPSRPVVTSFDAPDAPGFLPVDASLDATGTIKIGESSDLVELSDGIGEIPVDPLAIGRVVRYGDIITWLAPTPGAGAPIAPGSSGLPNIISKVSA